MKFQCEHIHNPGSGAKYCRHCLLKLEKRGLLECETCALADCAGPSSDVSPSASNRLNQPSASRHDDSSSRISFCELCLAHIARSEKFAYRCGHDYIGGATLCHPCLLKQEEGDVISCVKCGARKEHQVSDDIHEHVLSPDELAKSSSSTATI